MKPFIRCMTGTTTTSFISHYVQMKPKLKRLGFWPYFALYPTTFR